MANSENMSLYNKCTLLLILVSENEKQGTVFVFEWKNMVKWVSLKMQKQ